MPWYALFVETGKEEQVRKQINCILSNEGVGFSFKLLIAKRVINEKKNGLMQTVVKKMFPGYILLETDQILDFYNKTKRCDHLLGILRQESYFKEVKLDEISNIIYMTDTNGVIGSSDIFLDNDRVIVTKGPLKNYDGFIKKVDRRKHRAKVLFLFNGEKHFIELSVNFLEKFTDEHGKSIPFFSQNST